MNLGAYFDTFYYYFDAVDAAVRWQAERNVSAQAAMRKIQTFFWRRKYI
jgi:hypothetical protein